MHLEFDQKYSYTEISCSNLKILMHLKTKNICFFTNKSLKNIRTLTRYQLIKKTHEEKGDIFVQSTEQNLSKPAV